MFNNFSKFNNEDSTKKSKFKKEKQAVVAHSLEKENTYHFPARREEEVDPTVLYPVVCGVDRTDSLILFLAQKNW